jgi:hypothetical protein
VTPETRAARERKQKIFVVAGGLFLLALLAFQLPRILGGSSSSAAATAAETTVAGQTGAAPAQAAPVALVNTDRRLAATPGKLTSFSVFAPKDPFVQQVVARRSSPEAVADAGGKTKDSSAKEAAKTFSTAKPAAAVTIVSVNGARQALEPGSTFPASDPSFVLVAEKAESKSVLIGVIGGTYAGGSRTTKLVAGKPLTLVNTATGARYRLKLISVGSADDAERSAPSAP